MCSPKVFLKQHVQSIRTNDFAGCLFFRWFIYTAWTRHTLFSSKQRSTQDTAGGMTSKDNPSMPLLLSICFFPLFFFLECCRRSGPKRDMIIQTYNLTSSVQLPTVYPKTCDNNKINKSHSTQYCWKTPRRMTAPETCS